MGSSWWRRIVAAPGDRGAPARRRRAPIGGPAERLEPRLVPAGFVVTTGLDAGAGSLRDAIEQSNRTEEADTITFAPEAGKTITLTSELPALAGELTIKGGLSDPVTITRSSAPGTPEFRILTVAKDAKVSLEWLVLSNGSADLGGGIFNRGSVSLSYTVVVENRARFKGGGVFNEFFFATNQSIIRDNVAEGDLTLNFGPSGVGRGGGIYNTGLASLLASSVVGNVANRDGGGIYSENRLEVRTTTLGGNVAEGFVVAGGKVPAGRGGAIYNAQAMVVQNSTIAENSANRAGGGIFSNLSRGVPANVNPVRIPTPTLQSSILADNPGGDLVVQTGPFESQGNNIFGETPNIPLGPFDRAGVDPLLAPLGGEYGGFPPLFALLPGSPAIDAGTVYEPFPYDPRGTPRVPGKADIGAFESQGVVLAVVSGSGQSAPPGSPFPEPLIVSVAPRDNVSAAGGLVTFGVPSSGASASLSGNPAVIDAQGWARVQGVAGSVPGTYQVLAWSGADGVATFSLTNEGVPTPSPASSPGMPWPASSRPSFANVAGDATGSARIGTGTDRAAGIPRPSRIGARSFPAALAGAPSTSNPLTQAERLRLARSAGRSAAPDAPTSPSRGPRRGGR